MTLIIGIVALGNGGKESLQQAQGIVQLSSTMASYSKATVVRPRWCIGADNWQAGSASVRCALPYWECRVYKALSTKSSPLW